MNEKDMEDAVVRNPAKFIGEEGLHLIARQYTIGSYRFDLLFEDRHRGKLIVELQYGVLDRSHMFKILDYCDEFRDRNPAAFVEPMIIANIIPPERKRRLSQSGIPFREIPEIEFAGGMLPNAHEPRLPSDAGQDLPPGRSTAGAASSPPYAMEASAILSEGAAGFSPRNLDDLRKAVRAFRELVLPTKTRREAQASDILRRCTGAYTIAMLENVFDLVDKGPVGPVPGAWFGPTLSRPNRNQLHRCPMAELSKLVRELVETGDLGRLGEWRRASNLHRMGPGAATILMYLHAPDRYNVWLSKTHSGLSRLCALSARSPKGGMSAEDYRNSYREFNKKVIAVREKNGLPPQAMDWFLFAVDEIITNQVDRGLKALIESRGG